MKHGLFGICVFILFVFMMITTPVEVLTAGREGLTLWWEVLFPALFPFFVLAELMLGFGIVHGAGVLLDPLMRPVFRLPGSGGFVLAMGFVSGYPVGARLAIGLRQQGIITRNQGERMVALASTSDPLFLSGVVAVGFFHSAVLAFWIAVAHYGGALLLGWLYRWGGARYPVSPEYSLSRWRSAWVAARTAQDADGRNPDTLLRDAIQQALKLIGIIGGLVVFTSILIAWAQAIQLFDLFEYVMIYILSIAQWPSDLASPFILGTLEVTLGVRAASEVSAIAWGLIMAVFLLSWGGLSVHAQIAGMLSQSDLRYKHYIVARLAHALIAAAIMRVLIIWMPLTELSSSSPVQLEPALSFAKTAAWTSSLIIFGLISIWFVITRRMAYNMPIQ